MNTARADALAACARQDRAELTYPFGEQAAVYKVAGKIFAIVGVERSPLQLTLKCDPDHGEALRAEHAAIAPGYIEYRRRHAASPVPIRCYNDGGKQQGKPQ